jgi:Fe-S-cluster-containing dehydrogenase component
MGVDRRVFIKMAGLSALAGLGAGSAWELLAPGSLDAAEAGYTPDKKELKATRWGMIVDMEKFNDELIQAAINACHNYHNVPHVPNKKQEIKWIWTEPFQNLFPSAEGGFTTEELENKPFITLCNHCYNPPCVRVCPTKATFKRESDGIVMMDMHRCIGCRYCMAACPYGARSFNFKDPRQYMENRELNHEYPTRSKGVVEKCIFCDERLAKGLMPACVEAIGDSGALVFGDIGDPKSEVRKILSENYTLRRKAYLGTYPNVYYIIRIGGSHA